MGPFFKKALIEIQEKMNNNFGDDLFLVWPLKLARWKYAYHVPVVFTASLEYVRLRNEDHEDESHTEGNHEMNM